MIEKIFSLPYQNQANPPNGWTFDCFTLDRHCLRRYHRSTILLGDNQAENISTTESGSQLPDDTRQLKLKMLQGETVTYIPEGGSNE
jgi:hypothetical protein